VAPTAGPTNWVAPNKTNTDDDNYIDTGIGNGIPAAAAAAGGIGVLAIIAIIVAALVGVIVLLLVLTGGTGLLIWKTKAMNLDKHASNFEGELVQMDAVPMGTEFTPDAPDTLTQSNPITMKKMTSWSQGV
jgi:hypothetical protein